MKRDIRITKHHCVPRSRGGNNSQENIRLLRNNKHVALHVLFDNKLPHEQIAALIDLNSSVLTAEFKECMWDIINMENKRIYKKEVTSKRK